MVPQDADDSGIGQRPTSTARRSTSTSAAASPARHGMVDHNGDRLEGSVEHLQHPELLS